MRLNTIKVDSKGRIAIPMHMRNLLNLDNGDELLLETSEKGVKMCPISKGDSKILVNFNKNRALSNVIHLLKKMDIAILENQSELMEKGFFWSAVIDTKNANVGKIKKQIRSLSSVDNVSITRN